MRRRRRDPDPKLARKLLITAPLLAVGYIVGATFFDQWSVGSAAYILGTCACVTALAWYMQRNPD